MRFAAGLIISALALCALLASHQRTPQYLRIDANPGVWPQNASATPCPLLPPTPPPRVHSREPVHLWEHDHRTFASWRTT